MTLGGTTAVVILAGQAIAAGSQTVSTDYTVGSRTVPGVATGLVLKANASVTVTATGSVCPGTGYCSGPDGVTSVNTWQSPYGAFLLPGAPAYGLVARVGSGEWTQVGRGPTSVSGTGELVFAFNDDVYGDNQGTFNVTVTYNRRSASQASQPCQPGWGYGDGNHEHTGPPGQVEEPCRPGNGYGDTNHDHSGPPGQGDQQTAGGQAATRGASSGAHGKAGSGNK